MVQLDPTNFNPNIAQSCFTKVAEIQVNTNIKILKWQHPT